MSIELMTKVWKLTHLGSTDKLVLLALADNANDNGTCWPSTAKIAEKASLSERAVQNSVARLVDAGQLQITERYGRSNLFTVTPADNAPPQLVHPAGDAPTPAAGAPRGARGAPTPAAGAPITIKESSRNPQEPPEEGRGEISLPVKAMTVHTEREIVRFMDSIKAIYPPPSGRVDWISGEKAARQAVLNDGATWPELIEGTRRMAANVKFTGSFVLAPKRFFGDVDKPWSQAWAIPDKPEHKTKFARTMEALNRE
jgi:Helix-turn-helix domain